MTTFVSLKAAAETKAGGVAKQTSFRVDPRIVEVEPGFNRPIDRANIDQFKIAIKGGAIIPDIFVRVDNGRIIMVDGEHRLIAVKELIDEGLEIDSMSATQFRGNDADRITHLLTSAQGKGLSPLEAGLQYKKLINLGWSNQKIHERTGMSVQHIAGCVELAESNSDVHAAIRSGDISSTEARKVVKEHGSKAGEVIAKAKAETGKKVTAKVLKPTREKKPKSQWPDWTYVEDGLPQNGQRVIVQIEGSYITADTYQDGFASDDTVYWMPAPPPFE
jgi:ParB-like chromosome segregation protein Spo0J